MRIPWYRDYELLAALALYISAAAAVLALAALVVVLA